MTADRHEIIARLNDRFRFTSSGGHFVMSAGVNALPAMEQQEIIRTVRLFDAFNEANGKRHA